MPDSADATFHGITSWGPLLNIAVEANSLRYPGGIVPVPHEIPGPAFFPGGRGLVSADGSLGSGFPVGGVMVLGHNYGTVGDHDTYSEARGEVEGSPTWSALREVLRDTGIPLDRCFFTNAFVGLLDRTSGVGTHGGHRDPVFLAGCRQLLSKQIGFQRSRLILALGRFVPRFLAGMAPSLAEWASARSFAEIDSAGPVKRADIGGHETVVAVITHTSMRASNVHRRFYRGKAGLLAEAAILRDAMAIAGPV